MKGATVAIKDQQIDEVDEPFTGHQCGHMMQ